MDRVDTYRGYIQQVLSQYAHQRPKQADTELQTLFDTQHDHYQLTVVGWRGSKREYWVLVHVDLKEGQIWVQADSTELGIAGEFLALGIRREDIVLGFQSPFKRQFSEFGTGKEVAA